MHSTQFRAWDKKNKIMAPVTKINFKEGKITTVSITLLENNVPKTVTYNADNKEFNIDTLTIMQCVNINSIDGKSVFEDDIVTRPGYTDYDTFSYVEAVTGIVKFKNHAWCIVDETSGITIPLFLAHKYGDLYNLHVIGNIYENTIPISDLTTKCNQSYA